MKIDAVAVTSSDMKKTIEFYKLLGFSFDEGVESEDHVEARRNEGSARLMIDTHEFMNKMMKIEARPSNHSGFAIEYDACDEVNNIVEKVKSSSGEVVKDAWDASWGQRYAIVKDPDGYSVDLYSPLT